jgi:hypothetical protein
VVIKFQSAGADDQDARRNRAAGEALRNPRVLIVSPRATFADLVAARWLDGVETERVDPSEAAGVITTHALSGLVVDAAALSPRLTRPLVDLYLREQPLGSVAVMSEMSDCTTLSAFAFRDSRVDLFFAPWEAKAVRLFLAVETPVAV